MRKTLPILVALTATAHAAQCPSPNATLAACNQLTLHDIGAEGSLEYNPQDEPMVAYRPVSPPAQPKLVVIFHGHTGPLTTGFSEFQQLAADQGMYSISLDSDFNGVNRQPDVCGSNLGPDSTCSNDPGKICGCYEGCYGALHTLVWQGGPTNPSPPGLPAPVAGVLTTQGWVNLRYLPIEYRLASYLHYLSQQPGGSGWATFLNSDGTIKYDNHMILAGLSRGAALAGIIAKNHAVDRLLMFSGPAESLNETAGTNTAHPTTYRYGASNSLGSCTASVAAPTWIADNDLYGNTGTPWQTRKIFTLIDSRTGGYAPDGGAHIAWLALHMEKQHAANFIDKFYDVQTYDHPNYGYTTGHYRALVSEKICETAPAPDGDDGHVEALADHGCNGTQAETTYRHTLWRYMLTD